MSQAGEARVPLRVCVGPCVYVPHWHGWPHRGPQPAARTDAPQRQRQRDGGDEVARHVVGAQRLRTKRIRGGQNGLLHADLAVHVVLRTHAAACTRPNPRRRSPLSTFIPTPLALSAAQHSAARHCVAVYRACSDGVITTGGGGRAGRGCVGRWTPEDDKQETSGGLGGFH
jgi:hypothetical protein